MMKGVGASSRVLDLIERPPAVPSRPEVVSNERFRGRIEFDKVQFAYAGQLEKSKYIWLLCFIYFLSQIVPRLRF